MNQSLGSETQYHLSNMVMNWAETTFRYFENLSLTYDSDIWIEFRFQDVSFPKDVISPPDNATISQLVSSPKNEKLKLVIDVQEGFLSCAQRPDNFGERMIVRAMIESCLNWAGENELEIDIDVAIEDITGGTEARHFHAFSNPNLRDYIRDALPKRGYTITSIDDANNRLNLGWLARERSLGNEINGREECCLYLRNLVQAIVKRLKTNVAKHNRKQLLEKLLVNHEAVMAEMETWKRTFQAVRALSEDDQLATNDATKNITKFNASTMACRIVAEAAICHADLDGGETAGDYEMAQMMSDALQIFHLGGFSDAMNVDAMEPKIRVSPAGDVMMNHDFTDAIIEPFGAKFQSINLNAAAKKYEDNYAQSEALDHAQQDNLLICVEK